MGERIDVGTGEDFGIVLGPRIAVRVKKGFPVVFDESVERGFRVFIHGADGGYQAGVQKGLHPFAELIRGALGGSRHFAFQCQSARFTSAWTSAERASIFISASCVTAWVFSSMSS